jgi:hypothetical protein
MFISKFTGTKKISELYSVLAFIPKSISDEIEDLAIVYRGVVQMRGRKGDLLVRVEGDKILNVVWDNQKGEIRSLDRGLLNKYIDSYDDMFKDLIVKESSRTLNKMFIINQKVVLSKTKFKETDLL